MKKISLFCSALAVAAMALVGCNPENQNNPNDPKDPSQPSQPVIVEDGFYVIGEATVATDFKADNAAIELMGQGFNEADKAYRKGMYEKYIALEGGKDFELVLYEAGNETHYGAEWIEGAEVETDATPVTDALKGALKKDVKMQVKENGFYHIILDLNVAEDLKDGAQIIIVPCHWGVTGAMNGWNGNVEPKAVSDFNKQTMTWTWEEVMVTSDGQFKFRHGNCWKYNLDNQDKVKAENSLGINGTVDGAEECTKETKNFGGGKNYAIKAGMYTITLTWNLKAGAVGESFVAEAKRTGDVPFQDYSNVELELVGTGVADQEGAVADASSWSWGNTLSIGKPTREGDNFIWNKAGVKLVGGEGFKVRTPGAQPQGDFAAFDFGIDGQNAQVENDGNYTIKVTISGLNGDKKLDIIAE